MEIEIGSNVIRNTSGVLSVEGQDQISLEIGRDNQLLITADFYDEQGAHIAKLRRNAWVFKSDDQFEITTGPESLTLKESKTGAIVFEARVVDENNIRVSRGRFFTRTGHLVEITPDYWRVAGSITMSGNVIDSCGGAVAIS